MSWTSCPVPPAVSFEPCRQPEQDLGAIGLADAGGARTTLMVGQSLPPHGDAQSQKAAGNARGLGLTSVDRSV